MNSTVVVIPSYPQEESSGQILANEMEDEEMENEDTQIIEINPKSIEQLCRTCLCKLDLIPIDTSTISSGEKLSFLLELCLSLKVDPSDPLPKNICANCVNEIQRFYYFRKQCHLNESTLKLILTSSAADSDDSPNDDKYDLNTREEEEGDSGCRDSRLDETATVIFNKDTKEWDHNYGKQIFKNETEMSENSDDEVVEKLIIRNDSNDENEDNDDTVKEETTLNDVKQVKEYFSCNGCDDLFASRGEMQRHKREANHSKESSSYMCEICSKIVTSRFKLNAHLRSHTKEKPYKCNMCSSMFSLAGNLMRHMKTHTGEKPHICEFCGKGFTQKNGLKRHLENLHENAMKKTKDGDRKYDDRYCDICSRTIYTTRLGILKHRTWHNREDKPNKHHGPPNPHPVNKTEKHSTDPENDRLFLCHICGTFQRNQSNLSKHLMCHQKDTPFKCRICSRSFSGGMTLQRHYRIHTGERPYQCKYCPKNFVQASQLKGHIRTHTGEKPYRCELCGTGFALNTNLKVHKRVHTGEMPYKCPLCEESFRDSSLRKKHCATNHGIVLDLKNVVNLNKDIEDTKSIDSILHLIEDEVSREILRANIAVIGEGEEFSVEEESRDSIIIDEKE